MMKSVFPVLFLSATIASAQQQTRVQAGVAIPAPPPSAAGTASNGTTPETAAFRIRVVDGRNGASVRDAHIRLWYDEPAGAGYILATDTRGYSLMPEPVGTPVRILTTPTDYIDCRKPERGTPPEGYSLTEIARAGVQGQNTCGDIAVHTKPGELVLYVRSAHWYESINRDQR